MRTVQTKMDKKTKSKRGESSKIRVKRKSASVKPKASKAIKGKQGLEKLAPELREVIEKFIPTEDDIKEEKQRWDREVRRDELGRFLSGKLGNEAEEGSPKKGGLNLLIQKVKRFLCKSLICLKFKLKTNYKYRKVITHDEWMLVKAEPGYFIYNYEYGYIKNPRITVQSPTTSTDYVFDPNGSGHILIRRGLPIGVGSHFKVIVTIK